MPAVRARCHSASGTWRLCHAASQARRQAGCALLCRTPLACLFHANEHMAAVTLGGPKETICFKRNCRVKPVGALLSALQLGGKIPRNAPGFRSRQGGGHVPSAALAAMAPRALPSVSTSPLCSNARHKATVKAGYDPFRSAARPTGGNVPGTLVWVHRVPGGDSGGGSAGLARPGTPRSEPRGRETTTKPTPQNQITNNPQTSALPAADGGCPRLSPGAGAAFWGRGFSASLACPRGSLARKLSLGMAERGCLHYPRMLLLLPADAASAPAAPAAPAPRRRSRQPPPPSPGRRGWARPRASPTARERGGGSGTAPSPPLPAEQRPARPLKPFPPARAGSPRARRRSPRGGAGTGWPRCWRTAP